MKFIGLFLISVFIPFLTIAQLVKGVYLGKQNMIRLEIVSDTIGYLSYTYGTSLGFNYKCKIIKQQDSILHLENYGLIRDEIDIKRSHFRIKKNPVFIFYAVSSGGQKTKEEINYELVVKDHFLRKERFIHFKYNHGDYLEIMWQ